LNELKVGLLALAAIVSLGIVSLKITANQSGFGSYREYKSELDDATGIYPKTSIKVAGINSGKVRSVELVNGKAILTFEVLEKIKVTQGTELYVKSVGFLGDIYLDLKLGPANLASLAEGSNIKVVQAGGLANAANQATEMIGEIKGILVLIKESLQTDEKENKLQKILTNLQIISQDSKELVTSFKGYTVGNSGKLKNIVDNINELTEQLAYETNRHEDGSMMGQLKNIKPILTDARQVMNDIKEIINDVKQGRGVAGKLLRDEKMGEKIDETITNVNQIFSSVNRFRTDISFFTGPNSTDYKGEKIVYSALNLDLITSPEKMYRFGVVDSKLGPSSQSDTDTTLNGGTASNKVITDNNAIKFNFQIARKFQDFRIRAGIFESTAGLGLDYMMPQHGMMLSMDTFNYEGSDGAFVRLSGEFRMWKIFYARLTAENLAAKEGTKSGTVSAGVRFNDNDVASLLGILAR
jgi:phospholipid/cholesterol/gamma-HCH transport system substrate-binding protein